MKSMKFSLTALSLILAGAMVLAAVSKSFAADDAAKPAMAKAGDKPAAAAMSDDMACCTASEAAGMICGICDPNAKAVLGKQAVNFELKGADGKERMLADHKGKIIVLTWADKDCPIFAGVAAGKAFDKLQSEFKGKDVDFIYIDSGAKASAETLKAISAREGMPKVENAALLMDPSGNVGHMYDAKTTPHCFVIDKTGKLVYAGAIDNAQEGKATPVNYVEAAVNDLLSGKPVAATSSKPYGCAVHYAPAAQIKAIEKTSEAPSAKPMG